jgi:hypothetical protein
MRGNRERPRKTGEEDEDKGGSYNEGEVSDSVGTLDATESGEQALVNDAESGFMTVGTHKTIMRKMMLPETTEAELRIRRRSRDQGKEGRPRTSGCSGTC